jgi:hypothetical protein
VARRQHRLNWYAQTHVIFAGWRAATVPEAGELPEATGLTLSATLAVLGEDDHVRVISRSRRSAHTAARYSNRSMLRPL